MPITADGALSNKILIGKRQAKPLYTFTNKQLALGSIKGTFNSNIISNELPIDTFSFNVNYDDSANQVYLTNDTNKAYVCAGYVPGTLEESGIARLISSVAGDALEGNDIRFGGSTSSIHRVDFYAPIDAEHPDGFFNAGDKLEIRLTVNNNPYNQAEFDMGPFNLWHRHSFHSETGLFTRWTNDFYRARGTGEDVLTFEWNSYTDSDGTLDLLGLGSERITVNGVAFNGNVIFGSMRSDLPEGQVPALYILSNRDKTPAAEYLKDIKYGTPVWWYCNGKFMMKGYYQGNTRIARTIWQINAMSAIGKLDERMHVGGIYEGDTFEDVLDEITGNDCRYEFDDSSRPLKDTQIFGWLPYDTARNNLHRLLFAMGAAIKRKGST